jgi:hypothetical protein
MSDLFFNQIGSVMVVSPNPAGQLRSSVQRKEVEFSSETGRSLALTRWIFADFAEDSLTDQWGNLYDHQVHSLLAGSLGDGSRFLELLSESGFIVEKATDLFVPFQKLDINSVKSSDGLRLSHPRAFALARRGRKSVSTLVTDIRDLTFMNR